MGQTPIQFKQGTSFGATCTYTQDSASAPADLTGVTIKSTIRDAGYNYYPLVVTMTSPTTFTLIYPASTILWVTGTAYWDIQFSYGPGDSSVFLTQSIQLSVLPSITGTMINGAWLMGN